MTVPDPIHGGTWVTGVAQCFERAGFAAVEGPVSTIPEREQGWDESDIFAELDRVMRENARVTLDKPSFNVHLLALSRTDRGRLMGLMFDAADCLPRQGAAVFVKTIESLVPPGRVDRKIIETAVHELGHTLNLVHRFDRNVRQSSSRSFMNYDWRYRGGAGKGGLGDPAQRADRFWADFDYSFDDDERIFLRHAPSWQVVPGGAPFGTVPYWDRLDRPAVPSGPNRPWNGLRLWLTPPVAAEKFEFGQPVFLEVSLLNSSDRPIAVPRHALDIKAGLLDLLIRPWTPEEINPVERLAVAKPFVPMVRRCFDIGPAAALGWQLLPPFNEQLPYQP